MPLAVTATATKTADWTATIVATATGGTAPYTYGWTYGGPSDAVYATHTDAATLSAAYGSAGTFQHTVVVHDAAGAEADVTVTVIIDVPLQNQVVFGTQYGTGGEYIGTAYAAGYRPKPVPIATAIRLGSNPIVAPGTTCVQINADVLNQYGAHIDSNLQWEVVSGPGTVDGNGIYSLPAPPTTTGTAVVRLMANGVVSKDITITLSGPTTA